MPSKMDCMFHTLGMNTSILIFQMLRKKKKEVNGLYVILLQN